MKVRWFDNGLSSPTWKHIEEPRRADWRISLIHDRFGPWPADGPFPKLQLKQVQDSGKVNAGARLRIRILAPNLDVEKKLMSAAARLSSPAVNFTIRRLEDWGISST